MPQNTTRVIYHPFTPGGLLSSTKQLFQKSGNPVTTGATLIPSCLPRRKNHGKWQPFRNTCPAKAAKKSKKWQPFGNTYPSGAINNRKLS